MTNEEESGMELYGTSPGVVAFFMILFSVFVAIVVLPMSIFYASILAEGGYIEPIFIDDYLAFAYWPPVLVPLTILNIAYIWKLVNYYRGDCTSYSVFWVGLLSVILPTVYAVLLFGFLSPSETLFAISPIYLPFIAGIIFMHKKPGPELISPWQGDPRDGSWWSLKKPDWWDRMFPLSEEDETKGFEPESKSEWLATE